MPGSPDAAVFQRTLHAMAMPFVVTVARRPADVSERDLEAAAAAMQADLTWADEVFSLWKEDSPLSRLARGDIHIDDCPPAVGEVLAECERYREATDGAFDARRPDGAVDPTGLVKTWAVMRASRHLDQLGVGDFIIGASGDVLSSGLDPAGQPWRIGIADPRYAGDPQAGDLVDMVELSDERRALCTSGTAQHGEHIWNTDGRMEARYAQVSVVGADLVAADAWATATVAGGAKTALAAQAAGFEVLCIESAQGAGELAAVTSPGWPGAAS